VGMPYSYTFYSFAGRYDAFKELCIEKVVDCLVGIVN